MRKLLLLAGLAALAWRVLRRRSHVAAEQVIVGYEDGSAVALDAAAPERSRFLALAREALAR
jgi:hypothetical protein